MKVALGLGSSLGDRQGHLERTLRQLDAKRDLRLLRVSRWYRTPPMRGGTARGYFVNGVALFESRSSPHKLMETCIELERAAGRRRSKFWGDRTLDLDVLLAGDWILDGPGLTLPHPGGVDADVLAHTPDNPTFLALTVAREDARDIRYRGDRKVFERRTEPYVYLGRVHQHYHRYYDLYVRQDAHIPPLPEDLVVNRLGPHP